MKYFTPKFQAQILLTLFLGLTSILSFGEGTKQTAPNSSDEVSLCINNTTYGRFARYGSNDVERLYVRIQNPNTEKVYLGFSRGKNSPTSYEINSYFRIVAPNGNVVYGPQLLDGSTSNITGPNNVQKWIKATNGPNGIDGTTNGYNAFVFNPSGLPAGDYWVEFNRSGWGSEIYINYYDITVASGSSSIEGRVWSKRWALSLPDADTDFNGAFYVFAPDLGHEAGDVTQEGFVSMIDYDGAGFRPWYFNVSFNSTGTGNTGNAAQDRKSVKNSLATSPEYEVFLTDPDINIWQNGSYQDQITDIHLNRCAIYDNCINVTVYGSGDVEALIDLHPEGAPDGIYTPGTADRILVAHVDADPLLPPPYITCIPWDGLDGNGDLVEVDETFVIVVTFAQAAFHFPVYDIEENEFGFSASTVRPASPPGYVLDFYWDDSNIAYPSYTGSPLVNLSGCTPAATPPGGCHTWNGFTGSNNTPQYGNRNTINTWWYAYREHASSSVMMPDYIVATGEMDFFASPVNPISLDGYYTWANSGDPFGDEVLWSTAGTGTFNPNPGATTQYTPSAADIANGSVVITMYPDPDFDCTTPAHSFTIYFCTLDATVETENVSCFGASDGSITVNVTSGTAPYNYCLNGDPYQSSNVFDNLPAGTYQVNVIDGNDCTITISDIIITEAENNLEVSIDSQTNVTCFGESDGEATASATGGTAPYTFSWNTDPIQTTATATGLAPGSYIVTVTDNNGCTDTGDVTITQSDELIADASVTTPIACNGGTATVTITAEGGDENYTFTFNGTSNATGVFAGVAAGTAYSWSVVDGNLCEDSGTLDVEENDELIADANVTTPIACNGGTATVTITAEGGDENYTFTFNGTSNATGVFAGVAAGTAYSWSVVDGNLCEDSGTLDVEENDELIADANVTTPIACNGGTATVTITAEGGDENYTFTFNGTSNATGVFAGVAAGTAYSWSVVDGNLCEDSGTLDVEENDELIADANVTTPIACNGGTATVTITAEGGDENYTFTFNGTSNATGVFAGVAAGTAYSWSVVDGNLCEDSGTLDVEENDELIADANVTTPIACNGGTATVTITAEGGDENYTFTFNGTSNATGVFAGVAAGTAYSWSVVDGNLCEDSGTLDVEENDELIADANVTTPIACNGGTATVTITAEGGDENYTFTFNGTSNATGVFAGVAAGTAYSWSVVDGNLCEDSGTLDVEENDELIADANVTTPIACNGGTATVTITAEGGDENYTFTFNGTSNATGVFAGVAAGTAYAWSVVDGNLCEDSGTLDVEENDELIADANVTTPIACNGGTATVTITAEGGTGTYTYTFNGVTQVGDGVFSGIDAGTAYAWSVVDGNLCEDSGTLDVEENDELIADANVTTPIACNGGTATVTITAEGGDENYTFTFNGTSNATGVFAGVAAGTAYSWSVVDGNLCEDSGTLDVEENDELIADANVTTPIACNGGTATVTITAEGGDENYTFTFNGTSNATGVFAGVAAGTAYSWSVVDGNLCEDSGTLDVEENDELIADANVTTPIACNGGTATVTITAEGGDENYTYTFNGVSNATGVFSGVAAGTAYSWSVVDGNLCEDSGTLDVEENDELIADANVTTPIACNGGTATVTITAEGGDENYTFTFNGTSNATGVFAGVAAGTAYSWSVVDGNLCEDSGTLDVEENDELIADANVTTPIACNGGTATVTITAEGGDENYTFTFNGISNATGVFAGVAAGTAYSWSVVDGNLCEDSGTLDVEENDELIADANVTTPIACNGGTATVTITAEGGDENYTFTFNGTSNATGVFAGVAAGTAYSWSVVDGNLCEDSGTLDVEENDELIADASVTTPIACNGGTATVTITAEGGDEDYTYTFNGVSNATGVFSGVAAGTAYSWSVVDGNLCEDSGTLDVEENDELIADANVTTPIACNGGTATVTITAEGGDENYTFTFNGTSNATGVFAGVAAGTAYSWSVVDGNLCEDSGTLDVEENDELIADANVTTPIACNGGTATVTITAEGGDENYTFTFNGTSNATGVFAGVAAGTAYSWSVVDGNLCEDSGTLDVEENDELIADANVTTPIACNGGTATVTITAEGGDENYTFTFNGISNATGVFAGVAAGTAYSWSVVDGNLCEDSGTLDVEENDELIADANVTTPIACNGGTATVTITAEGGDENYTFTFNGTSNATGVFAGVAAGTAYSWSVVDGNLCEDSGTLDVEENDELIADASVTTPIACNGGTATVTITAEGGDEDYTYTFNGVSNATGVFSGVAAGTAYSWSVVDGNLCEDSGTLDVEENDELIADASVTTPIACNGGTATVTITAEGGDENYTFTFNGTSNATGVFAGVAAGTAYSWSVVDGNLCEDSGTLDVEENDELIADANVTTPIACNGGTATVTITAEGGDENYTFTFNGTSNATGVFAGVAAGTAYSWSVVDGNLCEDSGTLDVTQPETLVLTITTQTNVSCFGGNDGTATVGVTGGTTPYTYLWSNGQTEATATGLAAGTYNVVVTDSNGCFDETTVTITEPDQIMVDAGVNAEICETGTYTMQGNAANYDYVEWSGGAGSFSNMNDLNAIYTPGIEETGTVILTLTAYGIGDCDDAQDQMALIINAAPTVDAGADTEICETGSYQLQGSATNYNYVVWSGGNGTFSNINDLNAIYTPAEGETGNITLTLTAYGNGVCSDEISEDNMTLTITPAPIADAGSDGETCEMTIFHITEASAENYSSIQWTHNGLGNMSGANGLTPVYMPAVGETGTITLTMTVYGNGSCEEATDEMTLTITAGAIADAGPDAETCEMMSFTITDASAQNYSSVLWTHNGTGSLSDANTLSPTYTPGNAETGQVTLTLTVSGTGSCSDVEDSMTLNITPKPIANAGVDAEVCQNSMITLQGAASNYSYVEWTGGNGTFSDINDLNASYTPGVGETGAITLTLSAYGNGSCEDVSDEMTLTITPAPIVFAGADAEVCEDGVFELQGTASNYSSVMWTGGNGTFSDANSLNALYTPGENETGTIVLTLTAYGNGSCEETSDEMTLTITALPVVDAGPAGQTCEETNYEITGASASNYTTIHWTTDGAGILYNASTINPIYAPAEGEIGVVTFTLTATGNGSCGEVSDETTLTILGAPAAYAGPDEQTCQNQAFTVTGASAENYNSVSWSHNGAGSLTDANTLNPTYIPAADELGEVVLTLNVQGNAYCGDATDEMTLTIISGAYAFAGEDATVCETELYELADATANNYTSILWTTSGDGEFSNNTILNPVYSAGSGDLLSGNVTLTLTVNGVGSCGDVSDEMTITYNPVPEVFAGEDANTCANDAYTITDATAINYGSLLWTTNGDGTFNNNNLLNPIYTPGTADITAGSVVLFITAYSETSCPDVTDEMTLSITLQPDVYAGEDALTCGTDGYELIDATADMHESLLWTTSGDGVFDDATIQNPVYTPGTDDISEGSVVLTLTAFGSGSCGDASDEMTLEFVPEPTVYAGEDVETCASDASIEIGSSSASNYVSLMWTTSGDGSFDDNTILDPIYTAGANDIASGQVTLTLTAFAAGNCNDAIDEMLVMINANPVADAGTDQTIQIGTSTTLTGSATGGSGLYAYYWSPEELLVDPNEQNPTTVGLNTNPTIFILQVTDGMTGCYAYDTVLINLENIPEDVVVAVDDYDTTDFNTTTVIDILLNDAYPSEEIPNISICDAPANGMVVINSDGTITYTPNIDFVGEDVFCYKICDAELTNLCDSAMVYVQVQEGSTPPDDLIIFNALTPNGDGMNDTWIIQGIENYPDNKVYLFNRWGDEIHFLEGYDNTRIYWDGKNKKDRMLPDGTYYYVFYIKIEGVEKVFTGWVFMHGANQQ